MSPKFNTKWARSHSEPVLNEGPSYVDMTGYIPPREQIENMMEAGVNLARYRQGLYFPGIEDDITPIYQDKLQVTETFKNLEKKGQKIVAETVANNEKGEAERLKIRIIEEEDARRAAEKQEKAPE